jgi:hypothetical protein
VSLRRLRRLAFWVGVPAVVGTIVLFRNALYAGDDFVARTLEAIGSALPAPLDDVWFHYLGTLVSLGVLAGFLARGPRLAPVPALPVLFLPTYVAGLESVGLIAWRLRLHWYGYVPTVHELVTVPFVLSVAVQGACVIVCALAARDCGHRSALWLPIPSVAGAIVLATALPWSISWMVMRPA